MQTQLANIDPFHSPGDPFTCLYPAEDTVNGEPAIEVSINNFNYERPYTQTAAKGILDALNQDIANLTGTQNPDTAIKGGRFDYTIKTGNPPASFSLEQASVAACTPGDPNNPDYADSPVQPDQQNTGCETGGSGGSSGGSSGKKLRLRQTSGSVADQLSYAIVKQTLNCFDQFINAFHPTGNSQDAVVPDFAINITDAHGSLAYGRLAHDADPVANDGTVGGKTQENTAVNQPASINGY